MRHLSSLDKTANKVNKSVKSPPKQKGTTGKKAYGDAELTKGNKSKPKKGKC